MRRRCSCQQVQRRALLAVYAFNVEISRVRDQVSQPLPGEMRLQWWTDMLEAPAMAASRAIRWRPNCLQTIAEFRLPVEPLSRLIEEHQFDLYNDPMPSMAALEGYVTDTSSALLSLGARVAVQPSAVIDHLARHAGLAQGMAQVIAALPFDIARRQLFLPLQLLQQHGSGMKRSFQASRRCGRVPAIDQLAGDARKHLGTGFELLTQVPPQVRPVFLPLALVRRELARCHVLISIRSCRRRRRGSGPYGHCGALRGRRSLPGRCPREFSARRTPRSGVPSTPRPLDEYVRLWNTGSPAFAGDASAI
jgi:phytoene synthase